MFCRLYQLMISWRLDRQRALPDWVRAHVRSCQTCAAYLRTCEQLSACLHYEAESDKNSCPAHVQEKIMAGVGPTPYQANTSSVMIPKRRHHYAALLAASLFIALAALWLWRDHRADKAVLPPAPTPWTPTVLAGVDPDAWSDMMGAAMNGEIDCLYRDTEKTVDYLVACLPREW